MRQHSPLFRPFLLAILALLLTNGVFAQKTKPFTGMLEYKISVRDTALQGMVPNNAMRLYTNDTVTRIENFSPQLGSQVSIRHMMLNKSYLLLTVQDTMNFAIQTDLNAQDSLPQESKYTYDKKWLKKKHLGMRAKRVMVSHPDFESPIEFLYIKKISGKYLNIHKAIPGLLVKYSVSTPDGILDYELVEMRPFMPHRDLFGIPADYKKVTFDAFMDYMFPASIPDNH